MQTPNRLLLATVSVAVLSSGAQAFQPPKSATEGSKNEMTTELTESWRLEGFEMPESVLYDPGNDRIIIGNMGTMGPDAGDDGYLSLVSTDGEVTEKEWTTGLNDPKGMAIVDDTLYVADTMGVHTIDLASGEVTGTISLEGAQFPNDVAADADGVVYVSDLMGETVYRITDGAAEAWLEGDSNLTLPNGLFVHEGTLYVGSMGANMQQDFTTEEPGGLLAVDIASKEVSKIDEAADLGGLDGVAAVGDTIITDDNPTGTIYAWTEGQEAQELTQVSSGAADLSAYEETLLVPLMQEGTLVAFSVETTD